jgi:hypothetical protein
MGNVLAGTNWLRGRRVVASFSSAESTDTINERMGEANKDTAAVNMRRAHTGCLQWLLLIHWMAPPRSEEIPPGLKTHKNMRLGFQYRIKIQTPVGRRHGSSARGCDPGTDY